MEKAGLFSGHADDYGVGLFVLRYKYRREFRHFG
jgi:hypothetical protein